MSMDQSAGGGKPIGAVAPHHVGRQGGVQLDIYCYIRDVDGYHAEVTARGVEIVDPLTTYWWGDRSFR
jgi:hypothetical protein